MIAPFKIIPNDYQWILALFTPLPKMLFIKLFLKICSKGNGSITHSVKVTVVSTLELQHTLFLVLTMGFTATEATSYLILCMDFLVNGYDALKIMYKCKKGCSLEDGRFISRSNTVKSDINCIFSLVQDDLDQLILTERVQIVVPLIFISTFLMAYYGPNAELIGNVKLTLWKYEAVTDVNELLKNLFFIFCKATTCETVYEHI